MHWHRLAIEKDRTCAACPVLASDVGARELQLVPKEVAQQEARLDRARVLHAIHAYVDSGLCAHHQLSDWDRSSLPVGRRLRKMRERRTPDPPNARRAIA